MGCRLKASNAIGAVPASRGVDGPFSSTIPTPESPEVKQQIVDMAMNASGIRDTARVLHVSPTTVINELKKKSRSCSR
jgi:transposase-like protein